MGSVKNQVVSTVMQSNLEHDAFELLDADKDGVLSPEEWRLFMEDNVKRVYGSLSSEDIKWAKANPIFPVLEVSEDMTEDQVQWTCNIARAMNNPNLEVWETVEEDPEKLLQTALSLVRAPVESKTFEDFHDFESKVKMLKFTEKMVIPQECESVGSRRRLSWPSAMGMLLHILMGAGWHGLKTCIKNGRCDYRSTRAFFRAWGNKDYSWICSIARSYGYRCRSPWRDMAWLG